MQNQDMPKGHVAERPKQIPEAIRKIDKSLATLDTRVEALEENLESVATTTAMTTNQDGDTSNTPDHKKLCPVAAKLDAFAEEIIQRNYQLANILDTLEL